MSRRDTARLRGAARAPSEHAEDRGGAQTGRVAPFRARRGRAPGALRPRLARLLALWLALGGAPACSGPFLVFPGGALSGELVTEPVTDWSFASGGTLELETRPQHPYSVTLRAVVRDGVLYVDAAERRRWHAFLRADRRVRVRIAGRVYPLEAVLVGRPGELPGFDPDRFVYRLDPRSE